MNLDLSKFKKIKDEKNEATLQHPKGHQLRIAKMALSEKLKKQLSSLPMHLAGGGEAESDDDDSLLPQFQDFAAAATPSTIEVPSETPVPETLPTVSTSPSVAPAASSASLPGVDEQLGGIYGQAKATGDLGNEKAKLLDQQIIQQQEAAKNYQTMADSHFNELKSFVSDVDKQHINPNRIWQSMNTAQKISTGIGVLLGGMGAGLTHSENPAMQYLNSMIDRDVEAQKSEIGKKENLLTANIKIYGDHRQAVLMTQAMQQAAVLSQLQKAEAEAQSPLAKAQAAQAAGAIKQQIGQKMQQFTLTQALSSGKLPASMQAMLPKEMLEKSVKLPNGNLAMAASPQDAETSRKSFSSLDNLEAALGGIQSLMTENGRSFGILTPATSAAADSARKTVVLELNHLHDLNRLNEYEFKTYMDQVPSPGDWNQAAAKAKLNQLYQNIIGKRSSEMNNYLIGPNQAPSKPGMTMAPPNLSKRK